MPTDKEKYNVPKQDIQLNESTKRQKKALKSILKTQLDRAHNGKYIDQFNAADHVELVQRDKRAAEIKRAQEIGAMNEISLIHYYSDFKKKLELLQKSLIKRAQVSQKEVIIIKTHIEKETSNTIAELQNTKDLPKEEAAEYKEELSEKIQEIDVKEDINEYETKPIINTLEDVKEVIHDATVHTEINRTNRIKFERFCQEKIIPLTLSGIEVMVTVGDFFSFPLGKQGDPNPFDQHIAYLNQLMEKKHFALTHFKQIESYLDDFPIHCYQKHYNIFRGNTLKQVTLDALYESWVTGKLNLLKEM